MRMMLRLPGHDRASVVARATLSIVLGLVLANLLYNAVANGFHEMGKVRLVRFLLQIIGRRAKQAGIIPGVIELVKTLAFLLRRRSAESV